VVRSLIPAPGHQGFNLPQEAHHLGLVAKHQGNRILRLGVLQPGFGVRVLEVEVVDRPVQGIIDHRLELAALAFCNLAQRRQHIRRGLEGKLFADSSHTAISNMIYPDDS
jgi:hypothetical protein